MKVDHSSYRRNFCSCEKKAWKYLVEGSMKIVQIRAFPKRLKEETKADL